ncbi:hypothetical protein [Escherichia coli]
MQHPECNAIMRIID